VGAVDTPTDLEPRDGRELRDGPGAGGLDQRLQRLAAGHPSSPRYSDNRPPDGGGDSPEVRPLTDAEHAEHVAEVRERLADAHAAGLGTDLLHTLDTDRRVWTDERDALQTSLVEDLYAAADAVPCDGEAIIAGGIGGAGKSTILTNHIGVDLTRYLVINPDLIKGEMARRGLIPEVEGLSPMEASDLAHEESSVIAKRLAHRAYADGKNVIWDITMSTGKSTGARIDALREAGYTKIHGVFVDIPVELSVKRAETRHRHDHDGYRNGEGMGGRYIPPEVILSKADEAWGSTNRANFEQVKGRFDSWSRYDNSVDGRRPVLVEVGSQENDDVREAR
jgi:predicted ABC-type ATPase